MKLPIAVAFTTAILFPPALSLPTPTDCASSCSGLLRIALACEHHDVEETISHQALDCICNSRAFPDVVAACAPCVEGSRDEWQQVCATDLSWYDESSVSAAAAAPGLGVRGAVMLRLVRGLV